MDIARKKLVDLLSVKTQMNHQEIDNKDEVVRVESGVPVSLAFCAAINTFDYPSDNNKAQSEDLFVDSR